ncbi:MAG: DNA ligase (NAD+), partial [Rhodospirillaceae bacterium]
RTLAIYYEGLPILRTAMAVAEDRRGEAWQDLVNITMIGTIKAEAIVTFFAEPHNRAVLDDLAQWVTVQPFICRENGSESPLAGLTVVFTGTLATMTRQEAKARALAMGAKVAEAVSGKTDYVVLGTDAGTKALKAAAFGVRTLSEQEWLKLALISR